MPDPEAAMFPAAPAPREISQEAARACVIALRPRLSATARKRLEEYAEALEAIGYDAEDRQIADAIRFLLERQDAARVALARVELEGGL